MGFVVNTGRHLTHQASHKPSEQLEYYFLGNSSIVRQDEFNGENVKHPN
jgi:hypothetical protein